jgi:Flp pilus assembly pilin Flp
MKFFQKNEQGQDLAEYCLITALVALFAGAIFIHVSGGVQDLWNVANTTLVTSNSTPAAGSPAH